MNDSGQILSDQAPNVTDDMYDDLGGGIASSFPVISYRNSRWRVRWQGQEELLVDAQGKQVEEIGVCLVRVPNHKSKRYWIGGYPVGGTNKPPDCWSNDSVRPHPSLTPPIQMQGWPVQRPTTCAECCWDQFGTSMRQDGSVGRGKACGDYKRMVVKIYYPEQMPIGFEAAQEQLFLLSVPPDSLQAIKKYGEELARERLIAAAHVTFVGMVVNDKKVSYPKLTFRRGPMLAQEEVENIKYARNSSEAIRILNETPELEAIAYEEPQEEPVEQEETVQSQPVQQAVQPTPRPAQASGDASNTRISTRMPAGPPQARPATGIPPRPAAPVQAAPRPAARAVNPSMQPNVPARPAAPAARAINPIDPRVTAVNTRQPGEIDRAVNRPAAPPPSTRAVRPSLPPVIEPPQEEQEYDTAGEVEDELDKSFGNLAARGVIQQ